MLRAIIIGVAILLSIGFPSVVAGEFKADVRRLSKKVFASVKKSIAIVKCKTSSGSGFVVSMDGKKYFVTNDHVLDGDETIAAILLDGSRIQLGALEVADGKDLVRFEVKSKCVALELADDSPDVGDEVFVYGNSDGGGVATDLSGTIVGVGPEKIEVSVPFVRGNSGSAVLNSDGQVLGVATYATIDADPTDWTKANTRFVEPRRYALRMNNLHWKAVDLVAYCRQVQKQRSAERDKMKVIPEIRASFATPKLEWRMDSGVAALYAYVDLSVDTKKEKFKAPVVRVSCLLSDASKEMYFISVLYDEIGNPWRYCPPVCSYEDKSDGWKYSIGNDEYVYFLEGISYWRKPIFKDSATRRIRYCVDGKNRKPDVLLTRSRYSSYSSVEDREDRDDFFLQKNVKVLCFRYECWQNGALACSYDSKTQAQLQKLNIPIDWYKKQKHTSEFNMVLCPKPEKRPEPHIIVLPQGQGL